MIRRTSKIDSVYGAQKAGYLELIHKFPLRPIRSAAELDQAVTVIDFLLDKKSLTKSESDYLDVLGNLVERYESAGTPLPPLSDSEMVAHLIEAKGITQKQVSAGAGIAESTLSAVLSGKRTLSRAHIGKLAEFFHVAPETFSFEL